MLVKKDYLDAVLINLFSSNPKEYRINIFNYVKELPYQINGLNNPQQVIESGAGYCVSKHRLLHELFKRINIESSLCFVPFSFGDVFMPKKLQGWGLTKKTRYHVFLRVMLPNNQAIDVDASFSSHLSHLYTTIVPWNGENGMVPFSGKYTEFYIPHNKEDEKTIKKKLQGDTIIDSEDEDWIDQFNQWILSFYGKESPPK